LWVFFCRLVGLFLYILHIYLRVLFTFFNEVFLIYKKKKKKKKKRYFHGTRCPGDLVGAKPRIPWLLKKKKKRGYMDSFYYYVKLSEVLKKSLVVFNDFSL
jgi:hypothetical protein